MKVYAVVVNAPQALETRTKKDGTSTYTYAAVTIQFYDALTGQRGVHGDYTGLNALPDTAVFDGVREQAQAILDQRFQPGETVIADIATYRNKFGTNELRVLALSHQQPTTQQPAPTPQR